MVSQLRAWLLAFEADHDAEQAAIAEWTRKRGLVEQARSLAAQGVTVEIPPEPARPPPGLLGRLRLLPTLPPGAQRAVVLASDTVRPISKVSIVDADGKVVHVIQKTPEQQGLDFVLCEAIRRGMITPFATAYQLWIVFARMLLRDDDIGLLLRELHRDLLGRSTRADSSTQRTQDMDLARKQAARVATAIKAFRRSVTG
jgi:hypothetical protein